MPVRKAGKSDGCQLESQKCEASTIQYFFERKNNNTISLAILSSL
jgi:hypothetical protein